MTSWRGFIYEMKYDIINAEMIIRVYTIFAHQNDFSGNLYTQMKEFTNYLSINAFPNVKKLNENIKIN